MPMERLSVVVTRRLPAEVETRLSELFDVRLRDDDVQVLLDRKLRLQHAPPFVASRGDTLPYVVLTHCTLVREGLGRTCKRTNLMQGRDPAATLPFTALPGYLI